jgi:hypothetical protein
MKRVLIAFLAVGLFLGTASVSFAVKEKAGMGKQDEPLVVKNVKGENIGTIRGALEDPLGNIAFVIVTLKDDKNGKKEVVVPVSAFSQGSENGSFVLELSNDRLASAPEFNATNLNDPGYAESIYKFYGQTPPWIE